MSIPYDGLIDRVCDYVKNKGGAAVTIRSHQFAEFGMENAEDFILALQRIERRGYIDFIEQVREGGGQAFIGVTCVMRITDDELRLLICEYVRNQSLTPVVIYASQFAEFRMDDAQGFVDALNRLKKRGRIDYRSQYHSGVEDTFAGVTCL